MVCIYASYADVIRLARKNDVMNDLMRMQPTHEWWKEGGEACCGTHDLRENIRMPARLRLSEYADLVQSRDPCTTFRAEHDKAV